MKLLKQATELHNLNTSKRVVYENVEFPHGFIQFMESLAILHLIDVDYKRLKIEGGYQWADNRKTGGLLIETVDYNNHQLKSIIFGGVAESLELVERVMYQHGIASIPEMTSRPG
jgi:hypothetical protein